MIEQSINSCRVSFRFRAADPTEDYLLRTFLRFMVHRCGGTLPRVSRPLMRGSQLQPVFASAHAFARRVCSAAGGFQRFRNACFVNFAACCPPLACSADDLDIIRRVPLPTFDLTFLVTWRHLERYRQGALVDFICKASWLVFCRQRQKVSRNFLCGQFTMRQAVHSASNT